MSGMPCSPMSVTDLALEEVPRKIGMDREETNVPCEAERTSEVLSTMCNICKVMLENPVHMQRFQMGEDTVHFCLRVMVGVIILYDHVHPTGAFCKGSRIDIKGAIKVLKDQNQGPMIDNLLNALRYTTKHLNDETTPRTIRAMMQPGS